MGYRERVGRYQKHFYLSGVNVKALKYRLFNLQAHFSNAKTTFSALFVSSSSCTEGALLTAANEKGDSEKGKKEGDEQ